MLSALQLQASEPQLLAHAAVVASWWQGRRLSLPDFSASALPWGTGLFLRALGIAAMVYALWLILGVICQGLALWAERAGQRRLALRLNRVSPRLIRGLLVSMLNAGLVLGVSAPPASAAADTAGAARTEPDLAPPRSPQTAAEPEVPLPTWLPRSTAIALDRTLGAPAPGSETREAGQEVVVAPGDSLWGIAQKHLGPSASITDVASYWPKIHAMNREQIGADPHLLRVGTVLLLPTPNL